MTRRLFVLLTLLLACPMALQGAQRPPSGRVLVVPFDNVNREGRLYWLSEASAVLVTDELRTAGADAVSREERLKAFERLQLPPNASLSEATIIRVGQLLGAAFIVTGNFTAVGNELTVKARTIRLDTGRLQVEDVERGRIEELFRIYTQLSRRLMPTAAVSPALGAVTTRPPLPVFENYIKGLVAESTAARIRFLGQAVAALPTFDAARLALWEVHTEEGDHVKAASAAAAVEPASPLSRRARFLVALSRIQLKQYDEAFTLLKALADESPNAAVFNNLGVVQSRRGATPQAGKATYYFNKAVETERNDPDYAFNLGYAYWFDRDPQAAVYWLKEAVRRKPSDGDSHFLLGVALHSTGAAVEGEREKELARQLSSKYREWERRPNAASEPVPRNLERLREDLDAPGLSPLDTLLAAGEQKDQDDLAAFHLDRARRLAGQEQDHEAALELSRTLYLNPYHAEALLLLGRIHLRAGRTAEAIEALKVSVWSRDSVAGRVALGEAYLEAEDLVLARTEADRALALDPTDPSARKLRDRIGPRL